MVENVNRVDAIFCGDIHLRETQPRARTDDFMRTQIRKLRWLDELSRFCGAPIICAGDLLHKWKVSSHFLYELYYELPDMITILGNHDLPTHSLTRVEESGVALLVAAGSVRCSLPCFPKLDRDIGYGEPRYVHFGEAIPEAPSYVEQLLVYHEFVYKGRSPWPGCVHMNDNEFLSTHKNWRTVLIGDNHKTFVTKTDDGRLLVNCGSFTRMNIDQQDHRPCVFLWDAEQNTVERVDVPIDNDVWIIDNSIQSVPIVDVKQELGEFVCNLGSANVGVSFEDNLEIFLGSDAEVCENVRRKISEWATL